MRGPAHALWMWFYEHPFSFKVLPLRKKVARLERALRLRRREHERAVGRALAAQAEKQRLAAEVQQALRVAHRYRAALEHAPRYHHGSLTPGFDGWHERWQEGRKRVVLFAPKDYGGSMVQWARAINATTEWAARAVTITPHQFGYSTDLSYGIAENAGEPLDQLLREADVIQFKDELGFLDGSNGLASDFLSRFGKPVIYTTYGSFARDRQDDPEYRRHVDTFDGVVALTPDLCFEWTRRPTFIGHAVDTSSVPFTWRESMTVGHSPSRPKIKGTGPFLEAAERLQRTHGIEVDLITNVSNRECVDRKSRVGLFFDQAGRNFGTGRVIGWYGNSALEAASRGVPTIAHLSEESLDRAELGGCSMRDAEIINSGITSADLYKTMQSYFDLDPNGRSSKAEATRRWVERVHGFEAVAGRLVKAYDEHL